MFVVHHYRPLLMKQKAINNIISVFMACAFIAACAKVNSPSGGPKDKTPPRIVGSRPDNGAILFNGNKFEITFDEYVTVDNINENLIVSPPLEKRPLVSLRGKSIVVEYEDILKENTTYTFNFQDAIKDLNEGNKFENFRFVFSTGEAVDSLSVTGNLFNAYALDIPENVLVMLYKNHEDTAFRKSIPDYLSKAGDDGYFRIDNVHEGTYMLYALKETDNSKTFNMEEEGTAFLPEPVKVTPENNFLPVAEDTVTVVSTGKKPADIPAPEGLYKLYLFTHKSKLQYLNSSARDLPYLIIYSLAVPPEEYDLNVTIPDADETTYFTERSINRDTLRVWLTDTAFYSQQLITTIVSYPYTDTTGTIILRTDTIPMRYIAPRVSRTDRVRRVQYSLQTNLTGSLTPGQKIYFRSEKPLLPPDTSLIRFYEVAEEEQTSIPYTFVPDTLNSCKINLDIQLEPGKNYLYIADSAAFGNIYGERTDSTGLNFQVRKESLYGSLVLNISGYEGKRIIELLDNNEKVIRRVNMDSDGKAEFLLLNKGKYKARVVYDINGDGLWTTGDLAEKRQPEPVSFYPQEIDVKEDWVIDQDWDISQQNVKKLKSTARSGTRR